MAKSSAVQKLVERNLSIKSDSGRIKKKFKADKKALKKRKDEIKKLRAPVRTKVATKPKPTISTKQAEINALREEIAQELETKAVYVKRQYRLENPATWQGLTPGLAPVGYEPDSESDED